LDESANDSVNIDARKRIHNRQFIDRAVYTSQPLYGVVHFLLVIHLHFVIRDGGRIRSVADSKSIWWIEEKLPAGIGRLRHYGPYADRETAEQKIKQLRLTARYRKADLVASEEVVSSRKPPETTVDPPRP
jgi:hypothetical protein